MDDVLLSYLAGFFEGEGNVGNYKSGVHGRVLQVEISQNVPSVIYSIKKWLGYGSVRVEKKTGVYRWRTSGKKAKDFLRRIYPFIKFRNKEVLKYMI